jgi:C4-dicarboxylate-specific signal transduction histidine kinase
VSRFNRLLWSKPSWIWRYGFAFLAIGLTQILSKLITPHFSFPGTLYLCAVMLSVWVGGVGPGLLATVLSTLAFHYSFWHSLVPTRKEMPSVFIVFLSNILIALMSAAQRSAKESLRHARDDLKSSVQDLQRTNEALHAESRERKQTEEALRQAQADLTRASRVNSMGELTASLAHEVNQPIAAAVMNANTCLRWLSREQPDLEQARAAAARIAQDGRRASEIVNRVRLLFKKGTLQRELVDPNEIVREMTLLLHSEASQFSVFVRTKLAADIPRVMGDRVQLQQVLMNLMMNSIDAMKDVDGTHELMIESQRSEDGQVLISVSDTGVGLPPEQADKIFNAFFTTKTHGTGMGLRISRSIVESHGGRLWAVDNPPRGARFRFTLPANDATCDPVVSGDRTEAAEGPHDNNPVV